MPITVTLLDGNTLRSTHIAHLNLLGLSPKAKMAHVFPDSLLHPSSPQAAYVMPDTQSPSQPMNVKSTIKTLPSSHDQEIQKQDYEHSH